MGASSALVQVDENVVEAVDVISDPATVTTAAFDWSELPKSCELLTGPEARWSMLLHSVRVIWYNTVRVMEVSHERDKS